MLGVTFGMKRWQNVTVEEMITRQHTRNSQDQQRHQHNERSFMRVIGTVSARLAKEGDDEKARHVEARQEGDEGCNHEQTCALFLGGIENGFLREET